MNTSRADRNDLTVLERLHQEAAADERSVHQRDLAAAVGLSLGMTNAILKRLAQKGWLSIRKVNNRNIQYIVTPKGISQITRRSVRYLKRTIRNIVDYRDVLDDFIARVQRDGYTTVAIVGHSDLEFIVEYLCQRRGMIYARIDAETDRRECWYLYGENRRMPQQRRLPLRGRTSLNSILAGVPAQRMMRTRGRHGLASLERTGE